MTYTSTRRYRKASVLVVGAVILSGCASYSVVPTKELQAEREAHQALEFRQEQLVKELGELTTLRTGLEKRLASESREREMLEAQQTKLEAQQSELEAQRTKLEQELQAQRSAEEAVNELSQKWEQWRTQDKIWHLETEQARVNDDAKLYLLVLEKRAQIANLSEQLETAILEVVRAKAKLRSLESKAEAASNLAEAEIAVQTLKAQGEKWGNDPSVIKAEELTELSTAEFQQGNFSGALYLTGEAKNVIKSAQARSINQGMVAMMDGEVAFAMPLPLRLLGRSEIREGPGDHFKALFTSDKDTALVAYSYLGQWVRVENNEGERGWVFYRQLAY